MRCVVTGAAGFIGSHLCHELLRQGHLVTGVDAFIPNYPEVTKQRNLMSLLANPHFRCYRLDLRTDPLESVLLGAEVVFHLAGMPGLAQSWVDFDLYWTCNVLGTKRLLESVRQVKSGLKRFIYASTSSVYGRFGSGDETLPTNPISPYGVTKLAGEKLCYSYADAFDLPLVIMRYFSVYGPGQRPDMGYYHFMDGLLRDEPIVVYGHGNQTRGNTYISDCVGATICAVEAPRGEIYNVGGGEMASVWDILTKLKTLTGKKPIIHRKPARIGDQLQTLADTSKLCRHLEWKPTTLLNEGLALQWEWQKQMVDAGLSRMETSLPPGIREDKGRAFAGKPSFSKRTGIAKKLPQ